MEGKGVKSLGKVGIDLKLVMEVNRGGGNRLERKEGSFVRHNPKGGVKNENRETQSISMGDAERRLAKLSTKKKSYAPQGSSKGEEDRNNHYINKGSLEEGEAILIRRCNRKIILISS